MPFMSDSALVFGKGKPKIVCITDGTKMVRPFLYVAIVTALSKNWVWIGALFCCTQPAICMPMQAL